MAQRLGGVRNGVQSGIVGAIAAIRNNHGALVVTQSITDRMQPYEIKAAKSGGPTAMDLTYGYEARDLISGITDGVNSSNNRTFTYDADSRVLTAAGPWGSGGYSYDAIDNLRQTTLGSRTITSAFADTTNRVTSVTDTALGTGARSYSYDAFGNTATDGLRALTHDAADQPVAITGSGGGGLWGSNIWGSFKWGAGTSASYTYDGNLKRVKSVTTGADTVYTAYSLASGLIYQDDATTSTHTVYLGSGPAQVRIVNGAPTYIHADHQGSPVAATDGTSGAVLWTELYTPFGDTTQNPLANQNNIGFTGYLRDTSFGLNYAEARDFDPVIGRFLEADPLREADQVNLYAYVGNNPVNKTDPTGTTDAKDWFCTTTLGCDDILGRHRFGPEIIIGDEREEANSVNSGGKKGTNGACNGGPGSACHGGDTRGLLPSNAAGIVEAIFGLLPLAIPGGEEFALPEALTIGKNAETGVDVYQGMKGGESVYSGITNDIERRAVEHGGRFDALQQLTTQSVTRGEARAIEQALIERGAGQNIRNEISPSHSWYGDAVKWGGNWLKSNGF